MSKFWKEVGTNALESFNPVNNIENLKERKEAKRKENFRVFKLTHALRKQVLIKPKFIESKTVTD